MHASVVFAQSPEVCLEQLQHPLLLQPASVSGISMAVEATRSTRAMFCPFILKFGYESAWQCQLILITKRLLN